MNLGAIFLLSISCVYATEFSASARNFSLEILRHTQGETGEHFVISPFGIWTLMTAVAAGADGTSQDQLALALSLPKSQISDSYRSVSNAVLKPEVKDVNLINNNFMFVDQEFSIKADFQEKMKSDYEAHILNLPFNSPTAAETANDIIKKTGLNMPDVFKPDDFSQSKFILTNVINFKGLWKLPFDESDTSVEPFYDENNNQIGEVNMMYKKDSVPFSRMDSLQSFVLELPYGDGKKFCMLLILPDLKVKVADAFEALQTVSIGDIFDKIERDNDESGMEDVEVKLPRFKMSTNIVLNKPLMNMGVSDIFDNGSANFKSMTDRSVFVSAIVHNANIEVTETGTTASAVTSAVFSERSTSPRFEANRPFIYFVIEKPTATIVFGGIYSKPSVF